MAYVICSLHMGGSGMHKQPKFAINSDDREEVDRFLKEQGFTYQFGGDRHLLRRGLQYSIDKVPSHAVEETTTPAQNH